MRTYGCRIDALIESRAVGGNDEIFHYLTIVATIGSIRIGNLRAAIRVSRTQNKCGASLVFLVQNLAGDFRIWLKMWRTRSEFRVKFEKNHGIWPEQLRKRQVRQFVRLKRALCLSVSLLSQPFVVISHALHLHIQTQPHGVHWVSHVIVHCKIIINKMSYPRVCDTMWDLPAREQG